MNLNSDRDVNDNKLFATWQSVKKETIQSIGKELAYHIVVFHANIWIDINYWISSKYSIKKRLNILYSDYQRIFKEIHWLQFLFLGANYSLIHRNLRFIWEMLCKASYVYLNHSDVDYVGQLDNMKSLDSNFYRWEAIEKSMNCFQSSHDANAAVEFKSLWKQLNSYIHPSYEQVEKTVNADPNILITDTFNRQLSLHCLKNVDAVFDIVFMIMINCFPNIKDNACADRRLTEWEKTIPLSYKAIYSET